jgi:hypothetical protein
MSENEGFMAIEKKDLDQKSNKYVSVIEPLRYLDDIEISSIITEIVRLNLSLMEKVEEKLIEIGH